LMWWTMIHKRLLLCFLQVFIHTIYCDDDDDPVPGTLYWYHPRCTQYSMIFGMMTAGRGVQLLRIPTNKERCARA